MHLFNDNKNYQTNSGFKRLKLVIIDNLPWSSWMEWFCWIIREESKCIVKFSGLQNIMSLFQKQSFPLKCLLMVWKKIRLILEVKFGNDPNLVSVWKWVATHLSEIEVYSPQYSYFYIISLRLNQKECLNLFQHPPPTTTPKSNRVKSIHKFHQKHANCAKSYLSENVFVIPTNILSAGK